MNCYAETVAARFNGPGQAYEGLATRTASGPRWTGKVRFVEERLEDPLLWQRPRKIFVNSMSDLFHEGLSLKTIAQIFGVMALCGHHTFQVLTKRPHEARKALSVLNLENCLSALADSSIVGPSAVTSRAIAAAMRAQGRDPDTETWPLPHVLIGTSVEDQPTADLRIPELLATPAGIRFVSYEPALGPVDFTPHLYRCPNACPDGDCCTGECLTPRGLDWIICGGESGPKARPMHPDWARSVRDQCQAAGIPFFFKQWGQWLPLASADEADNFPGVPMTDDHRFVRVGKKAAGNLLDGQVWQQFPTL